MGSKHPHTRQHTCVVGLHGMKLWHPVDVDEDVQLVVLEPWEDHQLVTTGELHLLTLVLGHQVGEGCHGGGAVPLLAFLVKGKVLGLPGVSLRPPYDMGPVHLVALEPLWESRIVLPRLVLGFRLCEQSRPV